MATDPWQSVFMKNKNMRDLERYWTEQRKKAEKLAQRNADKPKSAEETGQSNPETEKK